MQNIRITIDEEIYRELHNFLEQYPKRKRAKVILVLLNDALRMKDEMGKENKVCREKPPEKMKSPAKKSSLQDTHEQPGTNSGSRKILF